MPESPDAFVTPAIRESAGKSGMAPFWESARMRLADAVKESPELTVVADLLTPTSRMAVSLIFDTEPVMVCCSTPESSASIVVLPSSQCVISFVAVRKEDVGGSGRPPFEGIFRPV
jgi:hypothetical protein